MIDRDSKEPFRVTRPSAARLLASVTAVRYLAPFLRREQTLSSAAAELSIAPSTLAYWLPRFVRAGIVRIVRHQRRNGMAMPVYEAVAPRLFVPFPSMPADRRQLLVNRARATMIERYLEAVGEIEARLPSSGLVISANPGSGATIEYADQGPFDVVTRPEADFWGTVEVPDAEAAEIGATLDALGERFRSMRDAKGGHSYVVHVAFVRARSARRRSAAK